MNESLISVPPNVEEPVVLQRFLVRVVEQLDLVTGARGDNSAVSEAEVHKLVDMLNVELDKARALYVTLLAKAKSTADDVRSADADLVLLTERVESLEVAMVIVETRLDNIDAELLVISDDVSALQLAMTAVEDRVTDLENVQVPGRIRMLGEYVEGVQYEPNDQVVDGPWTMYCTTQTTDRAGIQPVGDPYFLYSGTMGTTEPTAKQVWYGHRYTFADRGGYIVSYRMDVVVGNHYEVITNNNGKITAQLSFTAQSTGQLSNKVGLRVVQKGATFDLLVRVSNSSAVPTDTIANFNYVRSADVQDPISGEAVHANTARGFISFNKTDADLIDRSAELGALTIGDTVKDQYTTWTIQSVLDSGTYIKFGVTPAVVSVSDGITEFTFSSLAASTIVVPVDVDYWLGNANVSGLYIEDGSIADIVANDNAYGINIEVQEAYISPDWGFISYASY